LMFKCCYLLGERGLIVSITNNKAIKRPLK
jgi:hypothetical protein